MPDHIALTTPPNVPVPYGVLLSYWPYPKGLSFVEQTGTGAFNWASRVTSIMIDHKSTYFRIILSASEMLVNEVLKRLERSN